MSIQVELEPPQQPPQPAKQPQPEPEPEPEPEPTQLQQAAARTVACGGGSHEAPEGTDLVDDAIEQHLRRSRTALDKGEADARLRALEYLARARDLAVSQARLGQGRPELHALALLRYVEETASSTQSAAGVDALVTLCEQALQQHAACGEENPMLEGRCLRELSRLLLRLPAERMDRATMDRATQARRASKRLIAEAEAQMAALAAVHELEQKPCDVVPEEFGFTEAEQALVRLIAVSGTADWSTIARAMDCTGRRWSAGETELLWKDVEPRVRELLEKNPKMGCGHSCTNCPTKDTCKLHDSLLQPLPDLEDILQI
jgi:hypothetical protein